MEDQSRLFVAIILSIVVIVGWNLVFVDKNKQPITKNKVIESDKNTKTQNNITNYKPEIQKNESQEIFPNSKILPQQSLSIKTISLSTPFYNIILSENSATVISLTLNKYKQGIQKNELLKEMVNPNLVSGLFDINMEKNSIQGLENAIFKAQTLQGWIDPKGSKFSFEGPTIMINDKLEEIKPKKIKDKDTYAGIIDWLGFTDRYFMSCIVPEKAFDATIKLSYSKPLVTTKYVQAINTINPGQQIKYSFKCFMGPKSLNLLKTYDNNLKKAVNFGWFDFLAKPCLIIMNLIYKFIPNYGVAIIILTILIKLIFWPLGTKSYKSMNDMKRIQPLMMELREKYKHDKQKMNKEVMGLYKTYKVNPMGGCLPIIVQMPIFFALYRMLYQAIELRHTPFIGWINDLSAPDRLFHFNFAIPFMQAPYGVPVLTIIMGATMFLQQKMSPSTGDPTQAKMMMLMPLFMTFIFINFPAGLVLYWLVNNILSIGQQYYIQKKFA
ncbi:MAG: membrane protein insertase YidC [Desulfobacteraceae bacterium 4572_130]|nr:MAG: membrane protein insertase YidC [Desulfobacteraceae bacterium 4572_130]